ncbi:MAG: hypothetical protein K9M01_00975 [Candidatus Omnitrophica bacterium]|nr:hypothetical protein [Candidatus Omnitrophota bacterium]
MKKLSSFLVIIFLTTMISVFGQGWSGSQLNERRERAGLSSFDIYGDYFLFSSQEEISLDLEETQLVDVLKMLSRETGLNFISTEAIKKRKLTAYLNEVPLKEAMDILFKANNLTYEFYPEAKIFIVKEIGRPGIELKTKVYHLKYIRVKSSRMQTEIDQTLEKRGSLSDEDDGGGQSTSERSSLKEIIEGVITAQGKVVENSFTNVLIVTDVPSQFSMIDEVINKIDAPPLKVMIEVEVLDVSKDIVDKIGFKYGTQGTTAGVSSLFTPFPNSFSPNKGPIPWRTATFDLTDNDLLAEFHRKDTTAKILARPKILTLNNETAEINIITDEVIGTKTEYDDNGNIQSTEAQRISDAGSYKGSGVTLRVTPQVVPSTDEITLIVHPSVVDTIDSTFIDEQGNTFKNIQDRSTRSVVRLRGGETLLLGGLIRNNEKEIISKVPFLGDIPLLGALFRHKDSTGTGDRELMVFITPKIMQDNHFVKKKSEVNLLKREQHHPSRRESVKGVLDKYTISYKN